MAKSVADAVRVFMVPDQWSEEVKKILMSSMGLKRQMKERETIHCS